jgi:hypothetical protein
MKVYFPDTNFFFECRKASDLPWHELENVPAQQVSDVRLLVPSAVVTEIERHKSKGNSRTAKRARDASALLRRALESPDRQVELRAANPRVILELPRVVRTDFSSFPNLDPAKADHQIAVEYAAFLKDEPTLTALSDDTLLILAMRSLGFNPVLIPKGWRLEPEKDERDDKIDKLQEELRAHKQTSPEVTIAFHSADWQDLTAFNAEITQFQPSSTDVEAIMAEVTARYPIEQDFRAEPPPKALDSILLASVLGDTWRAPKPEDIEAYRSNYNQWLEEVRDKLPEIATQLGEIRRQVEFEVVVSNAGFVNATDARLTLTGFDGIRLLNSLDEDELEKRGEVFTLPSPPQAPRGRYMDFFHGFGQQSGGFGLGFPSILDSSALRRIGPRDPNKFYFVGGAPDEPTNELELECKALPHQVEPYSLMFRAVMPEDKLGPQPRLRARLQASNLKKPIERYLPVSLTVTRTSFAVAFADLDRKLGGLIGRRRHPAQ